MARDVGQDGATVKIKALSFFLTWCGIMAIIATWHLDSALFRWPLVVVAIILLRVGDKIEEGLS